MPARPGDRDTAQPVPRRPATALATHAQPAPVLSEQTGHDQRPVSDWWLDKPLQGLGVTFKRISMDRQLEEDFNHGPDALHLAVLFGIGDRTAMRCADAARRLLTDSACPDASSDNGELRPSNVE
jgi:hypothetical protein